MLLALSFILFGYLLGSVATAVIVCLWLGLPDPRSSGSRNPGATNVLRIGGAQGRKAAAITLLGDGLKGFVPVVLAQLAGLDDWAVAATALAAFLGHLYPLYFGFQGGKGVATAFGAILGLAPWVALIVLVVWLVIARLFRISSLAALAAALLAPVLLWWFALPLLYALAVLIMAGLLIWRHRANIRRLLTGSEDKVGEAR